MNFKLTSPCGDCPFRSDTPISLRPGRMAGILNDTLRRDKTFACHKTTDGPRRKYSHCAGALIMHDAREIGKAELADSIRSRTRAL